MSYRRMMQALCFAALLFTLVFVGCKKAAPPANSGAAATATADSAQSHAIETETVTPQPISAQYSPPERFWSLKIAWQTSVPCMRADWCGFTRGREAS